MKQRCPVCESLNVRLLADIHRDESVIYALHQCQACLVQFWTPFKNPGAEWYSRDDRYAGRNKDPLLEPNWNHRKAISFLAPRRGKVLDVGCGTGNFLYHAKQEGWSVRGLDFDPEAIDVGSNVFGLEGLEVCDVVHFAAKHPEEKFDLVTFFDVLEHVDNHREFIGHVRSLLQEDGYIAMSMPYRKGARWLMPHDLPPRHLTRWNRKALRLFLEREGFEVAYITRRSEGIRFIILKLRFRFGKYFSLGLVNRVKARARSGNEIRIGSAAEKKIKWTERLAKTKDAIIFGVPALIIWTCMLPFAQRYITLYCIARKK